MKLYKETIFFYYDKMTDKQPMTHSIMTRFEFCRLMGTRLEQLARGAPALVDTQGLTNIRDICIKELHAKKSLFLIERPLPNGEKEVWRISDMIIPDSYF